MISQRSTVCAFLLCALAAAQDQSGSLAGVVLDSVTKQPIKKVTVRLAPLNNFGGTNGNPIGMQTATTDAAGSFIFTGLQPGKYSITLTHPSYPQSGRFQQKMIEIKSGEKSSVDGELTPGASLSGRVLDEDGDPLPGCGIQLRPAQHPEQFAAMRGSPSDQENGEYRLFGIPPGKYIAFAQCGGAVFQPRPFSAGPDPPPSAAYPVQYYPLAPDAKSAQAIELAGGSEKTGVDFRMKPAPATQVRGRISGIDANTPQVNVQLIPIDDSAPGMNIGAMVDRIKGTFEFRQVFAGSYNLMASTFDRQNPTGAAQRIEVKDQPVEVALELRKGIELSGTVQVEGDGSAVQLSDISIGLNPVVPLPRSGQVTVKEDGSFTVPALIPAQYRLFVNGPMLFVRAAWLGTDDVTNRPLDLSSGTTAPLRIVLSTRMATITGTAPAGSIVKMEPVQDNFMGAGQGVGADQSGHFTLKAAPGTYRIAALPEFGQIPDGKGQEVTVHEAETVTVDVKPLQQ